MAALSEVRDLAKPFRTDDVARPVAGTLAATAGRRFAPRGLGGRLLLTEGALEAFVSKNLGDMSFPFAVQEMVFAYVTMVENDDPKFVLPQA